MRVASFFSGAGGLDKGFEQAGFEIVYANEFDKTIWSTFEANFPHTPLDKRSITAVLPEDVPDCDGFIGGPPCQSWSEAGARRGIDDERGQLFLDYVRLLRAKQPKFFLAENVAGILHDLHARAFASILADFGEAGYDVFFKLLNAKNFDVPEDRKRVIIVGFRKDLGMQFDFPEGSSVTPTLRDAIGDLPAPKASLRALEGARYPDSITNHEYLPGGFSSIYMSRNRVRGWDEPSFTIQAGGRHAPIHPSAPKMLKADRDRFEFVSGSEHLYRRLSVRECARVQTFPDDFVFHYDKVVDGYKMIGNAVPVNFARHLAVQISSAIAARSADNAPAADPSSEVPVTV